MDTALVGAVPLGRAEAPFGHREGEDATVVFNTIHLPFVDYMNTKCAYWDQAVFWTPLDITKVDIRSYKQYL